jgi:archaellum component FlaC
MLELGPRELLTFGIVLAGIATTWGVLKATIRSIIKQLDDVKSNLTELFTRIDKVEARQAVAISSIDTMANDILSPQILKERSERDGAIEMRLASIERDLNRFHQMHNGTHPHIKEK